MAKKKIAKSNSQAWMYCWPTRQGTLIPMLWGCGRTKKEALEDALDAAGGIEEKDLNKNWRCYKINLSLVKAE